jgi:hypothetical protein
LLGVALAGVLRGAAGVGAEDFDDVVGEVLGCGVVQADGDDDSSVAAAQSYEPRPVGWPPAGAGGAGVDLNGDGWLHAVLGGLGKGRVGPGGC